MPVTSAMGTNFKSPPNLPQGEALNHMKAIVIGASSGMGRLVAERLLRDGWTVGIAARRTEALVSLASSVPDKSQVITACIDVNTADAPSKLRELIEKLGGVDLYFHSSGVGKVNMQLEADIELNTVNTNALGFARMVGEAFRWMASHGGGHIAVISSIAGVKGLGPAPSYSATKAFDNTYIQALEQLANTRRLNIRFTDIRPGFVDTDLIKGSHFPMTMCPERVADKIINAIYKNRHIQIIDWRWRILVALWRRLPRWIWRKLPLLSNQTF